MVGTEEKLPTRITRRFVGTEKEILSTRITVIVVGTEKKITDRSYLCRCSQNHTNTTLELGWNVKLKAVNDEKRR